MMSQDNLRKEGLTQQSGSFEQSNLTSKITLMEKKNSL